MNLGVWYGRRQHRFICFEIAVGGTTIWNPCHSDTIVLALGETLIDTGFEVWSHIVVHVATGMVNVALDLVYIAFSVSIIRSVVVRANDWCIRGERDNCW
jgi:hypothetical protein